MKLSLLGLKSFGVWFVSLTSVGGGGGVGEGGGGGLGVKERTVISGVLCPSDSSLRPKGSLEEWLASWGSGNLTDEIRHVSKSGYLDISENRESEKLMDKIQK